MNIINARERPNSTKIAAIAILGRGGLVAVPTETVYGLGADATRGDAVARIFAVKGRPAFNPLICHVADLEMAEHYGEFSPLAHKLAQHFWPGPLTLVVPLKPDSGLHELVSAGLNTIALRAPRGIMANIARGLGRPIAAPSANTSGRISPTTVDHVSDDLGQKIDLIIDGGPSAVGLESTIIKVEGDRATLLRAGGITREQLEEFLKKPVERIQSRTAIEAPGMMISHYAPDATMRLEATRVEKGEALLAFGNQDYEGIGTETKVLNLSPSGDLLEAAANLFRHLKMLDAMGVEKIAVQPIPHQGLGEAINDRLQRAAAPRKVER